MNRVVVPEVPEPGGRVVVDAAGSHHLLRVQRVARGAAVVATDGAGRQAETRLVDVLDGLAVLEVLTLRVPPPAPARVVLLGLPRGPAVEEALTLGTEAGATRFLLVRAERSPPGEVRPDRLDRVLRAAVTQCDRPDTPALSGPLPLAAALAALDTALAARFVGAREGEEPPPGASARDGVLAVGPEGGWSPAERALLGEAGFVPLCLGPWILRTPTAVAAGLARLFSARPAPP